MSGPSRGDEQSRALFAKLALVVIGVGLCACALLTVRQLRMEAAHQLAQTRLRILERDSALQRLRAQIAARVTPERVEVLASGLGPMRQIQSPSHETMMAAGTPETAAGKPGANAKGNTTSDTPAGQPTGMPPATPVSSRPRRLASGEQP